MPVPQHIFLHFPHGIPRQIVHEYDAFWQFELGETLFQHPDHGFFAQIRARLADDDGGDALAEIRVRTADHGALGDARQRIDLALDFLRIDIEAAGDDQVLGAPDDVHITALIDLADIAGDEEAVGAEFGLGLFRHAPIAGKHIRPLHLDAAGLALRQFLAGFGIGDAQFNARQREADRAGDAIAVIRVRRVHVGLGHAVAFENGVTGPLLEFDMRFGEQRRRTRCEQPHVLAGGFGQARNFQQPRIESRHTHHRRRFRQQPHHPVGVEFRQEDHRGACEHHGVARNEKAVRVIDRQRVQEHILVGEMPVFHERLRIGGEVVMRQHRALGAAGGARRIKDRGEIAARAGGVGKFRRRFRGGFGQRALPARVERLHRANAVLGRDLGKTRLFRRIAHNERRLGVANEIIEFGERVGGVERQIDRAGAQRREIKQQVFRRLFDLHRDAVARFNTACNQHIGDLRGTREHVAIGDRRARAGFEKDLVRRGNCRADLAEQVHCNRLFKIS